MERYQLTLAYDGSNYKGFQRQGGIHTVQLEVEIVLKSMGWEGRSILASGRTDSGVHAQGQVIAFDFEWKHTLNELQKALNAKLPPDISVLECQVAKRDFHPRFDAKSRTYSYQVLVGKVRQPLFERYAWRVTTDLDAGLLRQAAQEIVGTHDFQFVGKPMKEDGSTVRTVFSAKWSSGSGSCSTFRICADAYLYHMVRRLVFLQVKLAQKRMTPDEFTSIIEAKRNIHPGIAPARGLCLDQCEYS